MSDLPSKTVNEEKPAQAYARRTRDLSELEGWREKDDSIVLLFLISVCRVSTDRVQLCSVDASKLNK